MNLRIIPIDTNDLERIQELMDKFEGLTMDFADASMVRGAERLGIATIFTLDRRDFSVYRPWHLKVFRLIPDQR